MAFTISTIYKSVAGDLRKNILSCTVDSASGNIDTGLSVIYCASVLPVSMATSAGKFVRNVGSGATARNGILNVNGLASGDVFIVVAEGK
jgi:hypothetical protein